MTSDGKMPREDSLPGRQGGRESLKTKHSGCIINRETLHKKGGKSGKRE